MAQAMDIGGLREQIKANATLLFPQTVADYQAQCTRSGQPFDAREAFDIILRSFPGDSGTRYQAILVCKGHCSSEVRAAATGFMTTFVAGAIEHLLDVLSDEEVISKLEAVDEASARILNVMNPGSVNADIH